jgi:formimidoylglutamate deiminase
MPVLIPELTYIDGSFRRGLAVEYSTASGLITRIVPEAQLVAEGDEGGHVVRLSGRALMPGFVNAHSHAFQRLIRGRGQWRPAADEKADFWTWREAMYTAANALSPDDVFEVSRFCFIEMLCAGITSVGEFHYLHRDQAGAAYANPAELATRVIAAADEAGIRICLLNVAYATGGIGEPLRPEQRRLATPDIEAYLTDTVDLADEAGRHTRVTVGVAPHSIRAVPRDWLPAIHSLAFGLGAPFHMHVSEQPAEVTASLRAYDRRPVEVLADLGLIDEHFTAVHATHLTFREVDVLGTPGPTVCACPTTERDLGDGFLPGTELLDAGARIALGSDSQTVIDMFEEMRLIEYNERLRRQKRIMIGATTQGGERLETAPVLLAMGTEQGARSLRLPAGRIAPDLCADFVAIDLEHRTLAGWTGETLDAMLALSAPAGVVSDVWVGGVQRVHGGRHRLDRESAAAFRSVSRRLGT